MPDPGIATPQTASRDKMALRAQGHPSHDSCILRLEVVTAFPECPDVQEFVPDSPD
ncbi:MAG: hypothetical protein HOK61_00135 [Alphaproteobacteria bacterium]|nr:hypothetical protein [Alphaproteobacteria bacterium]